MRQTNLLEYANGEKPISRVTRGHSDIPKQQHKDDSVQQSSSEEEESMEAQQPENKKVHHMTLKAMERKKKLEELGLPDPKESKDEASKVPRKRGRPKGQTSKKKVQKQDFQININEMVSQESQIAKKKEITLRKRQNIRKIVDPDSEEMVSEEVQLSKKEQIIKVQPVQMKQCQDVAVSVNAPKKRGRKKKVNIQPPAIQAEQHNNQQHIPLQKTFTIPKSQTYDNYHKHYNKIFQQTKQATQNAQIVFIFDKFTNPQAYNTLLKHFQ